MARVMLIDEDPVVRENIQQAVLDDGHTLCIVESFDQLAVLENDTQPDIIIVDLDAVQDDALELCNRIRHMPRFAKTPILCLAAIQGANDIARALDAGSDDCVRKPFISRELAARIRALLRRSDRMVIRPEVVINSKDRLVLVHDRPVELTPIEYDLLDALCRNPGEHLSAAHLLETVWNYPPGTGDPALVRNHVRNLRRKVERDPGRPRIVISAHGRGYTVGVEIARAN
jgi:DNA-binding response OmpR family regulator